MKKILVMITLIFIFTATNLYSDIIFQEDFEDTNFISRGWYDNTNLPLTGEHHISGSTKSVEYHFNQGATTPTSGGSIRKKFTETDEVYVSFWIKYSSNWTGSNRSYHPHQFYILTNKDSDWVGPAYTCLTAYVEENEGVPWLAIQDGKNIDESRIGMDLTYITEQRAVAGCNGDSDGYGNGDCYSMGSVHWNGKRWKAGSVYFRDNPGQYYKNDWHFIEAYFKLNSISVGKGIADGILKYWYDGELIINLNDVMIRTAQNSDIKFNQFQIAPWIGDGSPVDQTFWVDNLTVADHRTDDPIPPAPPIADAGPDQTVDEGVTVTLDGSNSSDPDDGIASYLWIQTVGTQVTLSDTSAVKPTFISPNVGSDRESLTFQLTVTDNGGLQSTDTCIVNVNWLNIPPIADAGPDQDVYEGATVTLDGSNSTDPDDGIASYLWTQTVGAQVTLSEPTATKPTFVTPPVNASGTELTFQLTATDNGGLATSDEVSVTINDNGITDFPDDVVTMTSSTGESIGIKEDSGGNCVSLSAVDPSTITNTTNRPENLIYGLINMQIRTDTVGGTVKLIFYLPTPAPDGYKWFKYGPNKGWYDYSDHTVFNATRDQIILTLIDGGAGDDDGVANGSIVDPSGLGTASSPPPSPPPSTSAGGGCFIATAAYGSYMEPNVVILREFRDRFLLTHPVGKVFVDYYYTFSPPIADCIARHEALKAAVRLSLLPVVGVSWMSLNIGPLPTLILMFVVASGLIGLAGFRRKMRK